MAFLTLHFRSETLDGSVSVNALLPDRPSPRADGKWPALYLLHGYHGDHTDWMRYTMLEKHAAAFDVAIIMPAAQNSFYTDMVHGQRYWTYVSEELPALCEQWLPISARREDRYAAGLSMGGYGAFKLGLLRPDRYAKVASLSGALDMAGAASTPRARRDIAHFANVFGDLETLRDSDNDLVAAARRLIARGGQLPGFYMACGTEDYLYEANRGFLAQFGEALSIVYEEGPGEHVWPFWNEYIQHVLPWMFSQ